MEWCVCLIEVLPTGCQPSPVSLPSANIDQVDKTDAPLIPEPYIYLLVLQCLVSQCDCLAGYTFLLYDTLVVQTRGYSPAGSTEPVRAPGPLNPTKLRCPKLSLPKLGYELYTQC